MVFGVLAFIGAVIKGLGSGDAHQVAMYICTGLICLCIANNKHK